MFAMKWDFVFVCTVLIFGIWAFGFYSNFSVETIPEEEEEIPYAFCGVGANAENIRSTSRGGEIELGKALFKANCANCHAKNMKSKLTGPALGGVEGRWADYPREDLYDWIRNSQKMIAEGHPRATELWNEWQPTIMNNYPNLTDAEIESILDYIDAIYVSF